MKRPLVPAAPKRADAQRDELKFFWKLFVVGAAVNLVGAGATVSLGSHRHVPRMAGAMPAPRIIDPAPAPAAAPHAIDDPLAETGSNVRGAAPPSRGRR